MSSCRTTDGRPKRRWETRSAAKAAKREQERQLGFPVATAPYRCPVCGYFHLGHYPTSPAIRQAFKNRHRETA